MTQLVLGSILTGTAPGPIPENELTQHLHDLLHDAGKDGKLEPDAYWRFMGLLAQGRGIADRIHRAGLDAVDTAKKNAAMRRARPSGGQRQRAYNIRALACLMSDMWAWPPPNTLLPADFQPDLIAMDLLNMLDGPGGMGLETPLILSSAKKGHAARRRSARRMLVGAILFRAARDHEPVAKVCNSFKLPKKTWEDWLKQTGGPNGTYARAARAAGRGENTALRYWPATAAWASSDEKLVGVFVLARSGPGGARKKKKGQPKK